jgi:hypothetical protein
LHEPRFETERLRTALRYWTSKCAGGRLPSRRDFDPPTEVPRLLPYIVLVDVAHDPLDFRYRLVGTEVCNRVAADYTGVRLMDLPHQRPGSRVWKNATLVVEQRRPVFSDIPYVGADPDVRGYQDLLMPLSSDGGRVDMIFALIEFDVVAFDFTARGEAGITA